MDKTFTLLRDYYTLSKRTINKRIQHRRQTQFYSQFVKPGSLVFDVGANVGDRCESFLKLGAKVVAVEPQPPCVKVLQNKFKSQSGFTIEQVALGAKKTTTTMRVDKASTISSLSDIWIKAVKTSGRFSQHTWSQEISIKVNTLDSLLKKHGIPDFCKVDVEGYESQVFKGLSQPIPYISFEHTPEYWENTTDSLRHLASLGKLELNFSQGESMVFVFDTWMSSEKKLMKYLSHHQNTEFFGDVYIRFKNYK